METLSSLSDCGDTYFPEKVDKPEKVKRRKGRPTREEAKEIAIQKKLDRLNGLPERTINITKAWADRRALDLPYKYTEGQSFAEVCRDLGITKEQYKEACKLSESFDAADKYAQVVHEAWWNEVGREGASGKRINGAIWNHTMNNRYGWANSGGNDDTQEKGRTLNLGIMFVNAEKETIPFLSTNAIDVPNVPKKSNTFTVIEVKNEQ